MYSKNSDYPGGMIHPEDLNGQHEGEGVSEGMRERMKRERVEQAARDYDRENFDTRDVDPNKLI